MKKYVYNTLFLLFGISALANAQIVNNSEQVVPIEQEWFTDFLLGPYLFIEHIPYDAVMLYGCRLGLRKKEKLGYVLEYVVGQQEDEQNTLGLTHHVSVHLLYHLNSPENKFRPYAYAGGGFLEFKSFTRDEYNMAYYGGVGIEMQVQEKMHSFIEPRYLNIAPFSFEAKNEIGVFCGLRLLF